MAAPLGRRDVVSGDHVYFQHPKHGVMSGEVTGIVGAHGFHARDDKGEIHQVRHEAVLGHKLRRKREFSLVDHGEDGAICTDETGRRVFLRNGSPPGEVDGAPMRKAIDTLGPPTATADDLRVLALELGRAQLEASTMTVAAIERLTAATYGLHARLDQLIALHVAALNGDPHHDAEADDAVHQGDHAAAGQDGG
jgi:hypothetical protein